LKKINIFFEATKPYTQGIYLAPCTLEGSAKTFFPADPLFFVKKLKSEKVKKPPVLLKS
jgi:hypothetical protein